MRHELRRFVLLQRRNQLTRVFKELYSTSRSSISMCRCNLDAVLVPSAVPA